MTPSTPNQDTQIQRLWLSDACQITESLDGFTLEVRCPCSQLPCVLLGKLLNLSVPLCHPLQHNFDTTNLWQE